MRRIVRKGRVDVLIVSFGALSDLEPALASLRAQSVAPDQIFIWHNGPRFSESDRALFGPDVTLAWSGENLGFGGGINRLWALSKASHVVVMNPDVVLQADCLVKLISEMEKQPTAVLFGAALTEHGPGAESRINAYGQKLSFDFVGINTDRGLDAHTFDLQVQPRAFEAGSRYLGPSGALFGVNRAAWDSCCPGPLFPESLFLYMEDVALAIRVRRAGGEIRFVPSARGQHAFSASTGRRSGLKLYYVERNRLWVLRALWGLKAAMAATPFTVARLAAYTAWGRYRKHRKQRRVPPAELQDRAAVDAAGVGRNEADSVTPELARALIRAWRDGFRTRPNELITYLGPEKAPADLWAYLAPLRAQLSDPTAD